MQIEWARQVSENTGLPVLILAPLAVAQQTHREGEKFGTTVTVCRSQDDVQPGVNVANYEMLEHFTPEEFGGIVLDESSILKSYDGKTRTTIIESFADTPYRLACTATPAPNDHMELGNHAEFLGIMSRSEMLATFFVHDGGDTSKWRIKGHAEDVFWRWVASWAVMLRTPSDLGYDDDGFLLPPLHVKEHVVSSDYAPEGALFATDAQNIQQRREARRHSLGDRVTVAADMVNGNDEPWLVWCDLNAESQALTAAIPGAVEITGSDPLAHKESAMAGFTDGSIRVIVTKPSIAGWGMNWQHCARMVFVGLSDSYESYYQAMRRCWRFGQTRDVEAHIVISDAEGAVVANINRKQADAERMVAGMVEHTHAILEKQLHGFTRTQDVYETATAEGDEWTLHLGDCVDVVRSLPDESIGFSVFSPPFASLYTYSASERDMGNSRTHDEFADHFGFLVDELYRVMKPGRLVSFHCMNLPTSKTHDGYIGIRDFRGELIKAFQERGFIYHSEVVIWKDPVTAMQRTKALGLLHKQLVKDSCMSRQGVPDYLVTMRKPGENPEPVSGELDTWVGDDTFTSGGRLSIDLWQRYASPVWMDINPSRTLQKESARDEKDERHICPLQLDVIERAMMLWSNPGDLVLSPFAGIGSEGYVAVKMRRKFVGAELKRSYYDQAVKNLIAAEHDREQGTLFEAVS
jgi:hypothetical protein